MAFKNIFRIPLIGKRQHYNLNSFNQTEINQILQSYYGIKSETFGSRKFNIAIISRDSTIHPRSSFFIRLIGPLSQPVVGGRIALKFFSENTTKLPANTNVCIVQRTAFDDLRNAELLVNYLEDNQIPLIFDTDDAFDLIDRTHNEHDEQINKVEAINHIAKHADQIWVSVQALVPHDPAVAKRCIVVPNSLDLRLWKYSSQNYQAPKGKLKMVYMGTGTHDSDFNLILPALHEINKAKPDSFKLSVIGVGSKIPDLPWLEILHQPTGYAIYPRFVEWFTSIGGFDIGLAPLVDNPFNRAKSDIKCLDYLGAGIIPVVSDVTPYQNPDLDKMIIKVPNGTTSWTEKLDYFINDLDKIRSDRDKAVLVAQHYISKKRSATQTAMNMLKLLEKL